MRAVATPLVPATVDEGIAGNRRAVDGIDGLLRAIARRVRSPERRGVATGGKRQRRAGEREGHAQQGNRTIWHRLASLRTGSAGVYPARPTLSYLGPSDAENSRLGHRFTPISRL
jgi:hypothetical protein